MKRNFSGPDIADLFDEVIDWDRRKEGEGDFFTDLLRRHNCQKVFDSAAGVGYDSVQLQLSGFSVISNEIDPFFQEKADKHAREHDIKLKWTEGFSWTELQYKSQYSAKPQYGKHDGWFDAVLCTGNSLALELNPANQRESIIGLHSILKTGGLLIIDSRNYERILWERTRILEDPKKNFPFTGRYYYTNPSVTDVPVEIHQDRVIFEAANNKGVSARFELYPFKMLELFYLLKTCGFLNVQVYEDFKPFYGITGSECDFFQYAAIKK